MTEHDAAVYKQSEKQTFTLDHSFGTGLFSRMAPFVLWFDMKNGKHLTADDIVSK